MNSGLAQGTAFTYQGRLNDSGPPANGSYDLTFALFDAVTAGNQVGVTLTNSVVAVSNGLFTTSLDFGPGTFPGAVRWLQLGVRANGGGAFAALVPRQILTPTPYAITSEFLNGALGGGGLAGLYTNPVTLNNPANQFAGGFNGNGSGLSNVNAATLGGMAATSFWQTGGNTGTAPGPNFIGTADGQALELHVNGLRAMRIEPNSSGAPNLIGGAPGNYVAPGIYGAVIAGGGATNTFPSVPSNSISAYWGTISGGSDNKILPNANSSLIAGGSANTIQTNAAQATIGGGNLNTIQSFASDAIIAGGQNNTIQTSASTATISGGYNNIVQANASWSSIGGGYLNLIQPNAVNSVIGGGNGNAVWSGATYGTIAGGNSNTVQAAWSTAGGGLGNTVDGPYSVIAGGWQNNTAGQYATIAGGSQNFNSGDYSAIPGGYANSIVNGRYALAAGYHAEVDYDSDFVWSDSSSATLFYSTAPNQFLVRAAGGLGLGINNPQAQLHVSSGGGNSFPQLQLDQTPAVDYARVRFTMNGNYAQRWDIGVNPTTFDIYSGSIGADMLTLTSAGLTVHGTFVSSSDRNAKEHFEAVDSTAILAKVAALPLSTWNFKKDEGVRHLGPMAQDFYAVFNLGPDDKHIATVDAEGVALAAVQGLNRKLEEKDCLIRTLEKQNALMEKRLNDLEKAVQALAQKETVCSSQTIAR